MKNIQSSASRHVVLTLSTTMTIPYKYATNTITEKSKVIFLHTWFRQLFTRRHELLQQQKLVIPFSLLVKKPYKQFRFIKRLSPFLLTVLFLPALFTYLFFEEKGTTYNVWALCFSFIFAEINFLVIDFALWNYYKGEKIFRIWLVEAPLVFLAAYFAL